MTELEPAPLTWRATRSVRPASRHQLAGLDALIVVTPRQVPPAMRRLLPELMSVGRLITRLGKAADGRVFRRHLGPGGGALTWGHLPAGGTGPMPAFTLLRLAGDLAADALTDEPRSLGILVEGLPPAERARVEEALLLALGARTFTMPSAKRHRPPQRLRRVQLLHAGRDGATGAGPDLARVRAETGALNLVRWLTALPPNRLDAGAYRRLLGRLARQEGWACHFLDEKALARKGAGAFLAVAQGNATRDAGIVHLRYRPGGRRGPAKPAVALVGKGILFDTGGTNLKGARDMLDMHTDMAGSAVALGVLQALTRLRVPVAVDCWLAITENRTGPTAYKPRDVVTACNGLSIEVIHSDAEGRMVLADTLALAGREQPRLILDYATLTGACVHALTERYSGIFTNRENLHGLLVAAGRRSGERVWPFPMDEDFDEDLKSTAADVLQCATGNMGDHILAARFLQRFVPKDAAWVHVDLAAACRKEGLAQVPGGPTGFGVRCTLALLLDGARELEAAVGELGLPAPARP